MWCCEPFQLCDNDLLECAFWIQDSDNMSPYGTCHHSWYIVVGSPYTTQLLKGHDEKVCSILLIVQVGYSFVCELCTIQSVIG